ncbi:MAG TPA: AAA family ATPase [Reyranella sp.]|nr:AAA family ATPase [Reyranella sp.]
MRQSETRGGAASAPSTPSDRAERRQLTLLFCELADSVALSARLDPEDLHDFFMAYQQVCALSVEPYSGYLARFAGDGVLIYFGYPVAFEDSAERAVRAGLQLVRGIAKLRAERFAGLDIKVRIGIATGLVVVGEAFAEGEADRHGVVGQAANLAARLQTMAEPNTVLVSEFTRQLASETFEYRDLGSHQLKGFSKPVPVYQVIGQREVSRLEARGAALTPFVGRAQEIALLLDRWERATSRDGQVVALVGQAGVGKSRVMAEAVERIARRSGSAPPPVVLQCSPYHSNVPLFPVVRHLALEAHIQTEDPPPVKLDKLAGLFVGNSARYGSAPLLADLLGVEHATDLAPVAADPVAKRQLMIEALVDLYDSSSRDPAMTLVFEDVQWIDPTSRELLGRLTDWVKDANALIAVTLRADSRRDADRILRRAGLIGPDGDVSDHVTIHEIRELDKEDGRRLAVAAAHGAGRAIDASRLDALVDSSGGIPLFLEELVKAAANGVELSDGRGKAIEVGLVPNTIRDALMAQLDQLGFAKEVAQYASVIGHEFLGDLLARIMQRPLDELVPTLKTLVDARILAGGRTPSDNYLFKHALIRDISYRSLLRQHRRQIHLLVARELARHPAETGAVSDDLVAQHYALGEASMDAIACWRRGAGVAIARSANEEAVAMLQSALKELEKIRGSADPALELDLVVTQAMAMRSLRGYSAPEVEQALARARVLCANSDDIGKKVSVEWGLFQCSFVAGDIERARGFAAELHTLATQEPGEALVDAHLANGMVAFDAGEFAAAMASHESGARLCQPEIDQPRFHTHGQNAGLFCLSYLARTQCIVGHLDRGHATIARAREIAAMRSQEPGHIHSSLNVTIQAVRLFHICGDLEAERRLASETIEVARRNRYVYYEAMGRCHLGWVAGAEGNVDDGVAMLSAGIAALRQTGTALSLPGFYLLLAQLHVYAGRLDEASSALAMATGSDWRAVWAADAERVRGDILAADRAAAEAAYRASLAVARRQQAGLFICKASMSLARLLQSSGRREEGRALLTESLAHLHGGDEFGTVRQTRLMINEMTG